MRRELMAFVGAVALLGCSANARITASTAPAPKAQPAPAAPEKVEKAEDDGPVKVTDSSLEIGEKIMFEVNSAVIREESKGILGAVADVLAKHPEIELVDIEGHTDATGLPNQNLFLSRARAASVREFLVSKGVSSQRLSATGFGQEKPIGDNKTQEGRDKNRRVEFKIVKKGAVAGASSAASSEKGG
jgi:OOP family OmpA-OmpF porin